jgi:hypothetical protein
VLTQGEKILRLRLCARQDAFKKRPGLAVLVGAVRAIVLLKGVLRQAVEGKCCHGAFETRGGDAPGAVGAAPAGEVIPFDPDQAFTHTSSAFCVLGIGARGKRVEHIKSASSEGELLHVAEDYFPRDCCWRKVTKVLRPGRRMGRSLILRDWVSDFS